MAIFLALAAAAQLGTPITVVRTFPGFSGPNPPDAGSASADMMGGVNAKFLVAFTNRGFGVWSKTDGRLIQPIQTQMEFWTAAFQNAGTAVTGKPYDPRIAFEPMTSRWFASANTNINGLSDHIFFAVSADDDPTHPWKAVEYQTPMTVDNLKLGFDKLGVYSTALSGRADPSPISVPVIAIPKTDLLWKGDGKPVLSHLNLFEVPAGGRMSDRKYAGVEGMVPAFDLNPHKNASDPEIYVNRYRKQVDGETILQIRKVTWSSPEKATLSEPISIGLGTHYAVQPTTLGMQPALSGGLISPGIRAGEARIVNAVVKNGSLWTIAAAEVNNRDGAFWVEIDLHAMKLVQHGTLADPNGDILFPSLNVDDRGNLGTGMSRTSHDEALSIYVTGRLASDPPNTLRPLVRAVQGHFVHYRKDTELTRPGQSVSWSDYSTVVTDPSDPSLFWTFQEATTNETMPREKADSYGTHWVAWRVAAPPQPKDATSAIVETFDKYPVVALAETAHAVDQFHAFYRSLIRDPAFLAKVNDVVIEFGNSLYQPILDHYILKGENVPFAELSKVWRSCPHNFAWEGPVYQEFLKTVHEMNQKLPANRRLRLLAGDAPIDWPKIHTHEEWAKLNDDRDPSCARVVDREVLQKGHRALVIMGSNHLTKSGNRDGEDDTTTLIEAKHPGSVCVVMVSSQDHPKMATWKLPALLTPPPLKTDADAVLYIVPRNSQTLSYMHLKWSDYDDTYLKEVDRRQRIIYGCSFDIERRKKQADPYQGWPCH